MHAAADPRARVLAVVVALAALLGAPLLWALGRLDAAPEDSVLPASADDKPKPTVLVIHGGAGVLTEGEMKEAGLTREQFEAALARALHAGYQAWKAEKTSAEVVEAAVRVMEDCELFNAGRGAAMTSDGRVELDAAIMEGNWDEAPKGEGKLDKRKRAGAVTCVSHVKNPISAARAVMEMKDSKHVLLAGEGAETFVLSEENRKEYQIERVKNTYFWTERRLKAIWSPEKEQKKGTAAPQAGRADLRFGTVGAVALDRNNNLAAGTSTGGLNNKMPGRVGDTPLLGAGTYADNRACGVSCTGTGEVFIRHAVAHDVVARMLYGKQDLEKATAATIDALPDEKDGGVGGLIALDREGRHAFAMSKASVGMYRGYVTEDGTMYVAVNRGDAAKLIKLDRDGKPIK